MWRATEKHKWVRAVKSKPNALWHFKVDSGLKTNETFHLNLYGQCPNYNGTLKTVLWLTLFIYLFNGFSRFKSVYEW